MISRIIYFLFLIPLAIVLIALIVANRGDASVSIDVFNPSNPALTFTAPMFVWIFGGLAIGIIIGGIGSWFAQGKHRRKERQYKKEADKLRYEVENAPSHKTETSANSLAISSN